MEIELFNQSLIADLTQEVARPVVEYKSTLDFHPDYYEDPEFMIIKHSFVRFNLTSSIDEYKLHLATIIDKIINRLEQELSNNASWMLRINKEILIKDIYHLNNYLEFKPKGEVKGKEETLYFQNIDFLNIGNRETLIPGYATYNLDINNESKARREMNQELRLYANQIKNQINILVARLSWVLEKFFQGANIEIIANSPPTLTQSQIMECLKYIQSNRIQDAFSILEEAYIGNNSMLKELTILKNRHSRIEQFVNAGILSISDSSTEQNRIIHALLALID